MADQRPYHIVNTALNLVSGEELAWQTRKAASFAFTPRFCGFEMPLMPAQGGRRPAWHLPAHARIRVEVGRRRRRRHRAPRHGGGPVRRRGQSEHGHALVAAAELPDDDV
ncbi:hypothetical protein G4G28_03130 [Massilia sp. Dwa41.01b]|uniref:hypothetical protein n=1 Tax=Massilia sp. Dwa41.01b TaxID=2709302 RepID=UPI001601C4C4|nr:hypothetical protein [Massilia sp. Dwa41.01b]QNA87716.1 hypothetical protein G4G28_03130 [Massilia sp. Dwa41.01b]